MIVEQILQEENRVRHYSDMSVKIKQVETGIRYDDAVDIVPCPYTYEETDIPIDEQAEEAQAEDYREALERMGVSV